MIRQINMTWLITLGWVCLAACLPTNQDELAANYFHTTREVKEYDLTAAPLPTNMPRPGFVGEVLPEEGSILSLKEYHETFGGQITVEINWMHVARPGDDLTDAGNYNEVKSTTMYLDSEPINMVSASGLTILSKFELEGQPTQIGGPSTFSWAADLTPGIHWLELTVTQTDGHLLSYSWYITIFDAER